MALAKAHVHMASQNNHLDAFSKKHLVDGEEVLTWAEGYISEVMGNKENAHHNGVLIVTNERVAFHRSGVFGHVLEAVPLASIKSVGRKSLLGHHTIRLHCANDSLTFKCFGATLEADLVSSIESARKAVRVKLDRVPGSHAASQSDVIGRLERLAELRASAVLTEEEFQGEKRRILGAMSPAQGVSAPSKPPLPEVDFKTTDPLPLNESNDVHFPRAPGVSKTCLKCGQKAVFSHGQTATCPSCGAIYAKVEAAFAAKSAFISSPSSKSSAIKPVAKVSEANAGATAAGAIVIVLSTLLVWWVWPSSSEPSAAAAGVQPAASIGVSTSMSDLEKSCRAIGGSIALVAIANLSKLREVDLSLSRVLEEGCARQAADRGTTCVSYCESQFRVEAGALMR